jgi:hypothetical protein
MKWLLLSVALLQLQVLNAQSVNHPDKQPAAVKAIVRADNSFVTYDDSVSKTVTVPPKVGAKISAIYSHYKDDPFSAGYKPLVFKVSYNSKIDIYVLKIHSAAGIAYQFLAYDHHSKNITARPIAIFGGFMENNEEGFKKEYRLLSGPCLYFSGKQIVIKERTHNGTFHNAEDDHFYVLNKHMQFRQVLCVESKTIDATTGCLIHRELQNHTLLCTINCKGTKPKMIGEVSLALQPEAHIKNKKVIDSAYSDLLISESGINDNRFLNRGSSHAY